MREDERWAQVQSIEIPKSSQLPEGWLPEGARVWVFAIEDPELLPDWEVMIPEYSIAGMGEDLNSAAFEAIELLEDYLYLCAKDRMSFAECRRPLSEVKPDWLGELLTGGKP